MSNCMWSPVVVVHNVWFVVGRGLKGVNIHFDITHHTVFVVYDALCDLKSQKKETKESRRRESRKFKIKKKTIFYILYVCFVCNIFVCLH